MDGNSEIDSSMSEHTIQEIPSSSPPPSIPLNGNLTGETFNHNIQLKRIASTNMILSDKFVKKEKEELHRQLEKDDRLEMLMKSISLANSLASMDTESYSKISYLGIQQEIDSIQELWKLEETSIPSLISFIHSLQSKIVHLQKESVFDANLLSENMDLHHEVESAKKDNRNAHKVITSFIKKTQKLEDRLARKQCQFIKLLEYIQKKQHEEIKSEELLAMVNICIHEQVMKQKVRQYESDDFSVNRGRTLTEDSALTFKSDFNDASSLETCSHCETSESGIESNEHERKIVKPLTSATLKVERSLKSLPLKSYSISISSGEKIGLQFVEEICKDTFSRYNPKCISLFIPPLLDTSQLKDSDIDSNSITSENYLEVLKQGKKSAFLDMLKTDAGKLKSPHRLKGLNSPEKYELSNSKKRCSRAFIVKGCCFADASFHRRFTIGSRLVGINDTSLLFGSWDLNQVTQILTALEDVDLSYANDIILTFHQYHNDSKE